MESHDNNYGFDAIKALDVSLAIVRPPKISVVIPYYETGEIFRRCLYFLRKSIDKYAGSVETIVVDDGPKNRLLENYVDGGNNLKIVKLECNLGRTEARNAGLNIARGEIIISLDSDILVDEDLISNHAKLHIEAFSRNKKAICVSFFEFSDESSTKLNMKHLLSNDIHLNDFRIDCVYKNTWIGCEEDKQYVGQHIRLIDETDNFRLWRGQYKAWVLPNMVLGGAFSVVRDEILAVGGFDSRFVGYGFTETSAVTKMIAERQNVVIPCLTGGAMHIEDLSINLSRDEKDKIFREKHDFYFNIFLQERVK